jgi:signal transduction histidine kinase
MLKDTFQTTEELSIELERMSIFSKHILHELIGKVNNIQASLIMLSGETLTDHPSVQLLHSEAHSLNATFKNLFLLSGDYASTINEPELVGLSTVAVKEWIMECCKKLNFWMELKKLGFTTSAIDFDSLPSSIDVSAAIDLELVLYNQMLYCINASTEGKLLGIQVYDKSDRNELHIKLVTSGKPIPEDDLLNLFNPYFNKKETRLLDSLGLYSSKKYLALINGDIIVFNSPEGIKLESKIPYIK